MPEETSSNVESATKSLSSHVENFYASRYTRSFRDSPRGFNELVSSAKNIVESIRREPRQVPALLFHGTIEPTVTNIARENQFRAQEGRATFALSPDYALNYADPTSETYIRQVFEQVPRLVALGQISPNLPVHDQAMAALKIMGSTDKIEQFGRIIVFDAEKFPEHDVTAGYSITGADATEAMALYAKRGSGGTIDTQSDGHHRGEVRVPYQQTAEAVIVNTPILKDLINAVKQSLLTQDFHQFELAEAAMMEYFTLAGDSLVTLVGETSTDTIQLMKRRAVLGRQIALSVICENERTYSKYVTRITKFADHQRQVTTDHYNGPGIMRGKIKSSRSEYETARKRQQFIATIPGMEPLAISIGKRLDLAAQNIQVEQNHLDDVTRPTSPISAETREAIKHPPNPDLQAIIDNKGKLVGWTKAKSLNIS